jgi:hypothetical protein
LEEVIAEMDRLVDEFVRLLESGSRIDGGPATDM